MTPRRIKFTPQATRDYLAVVGWWRANRPAAPRLLEQELAEVLSQLAHTPRSGVATPDLRLSEVRRVYLRATRYWVYYRARGDDDVLVVLRVWHASRGSAPKL